LYIKFNTYFLIIKVVKLIFEYLKQTYMKQHNYAFNFLRTALGLFLIVCAQVLNAQTVFTGPDNGDFSTAANWSNGLPAVGNDATVPGGKTVEINGTLLIDFNLQSFGTLVNKGATTVAVTFISGGLLENRAGATLTINSAVNVTSSGGILNAGNLVNKGNVSSNTAGFENTTTGVVTNEGRFEQFAAFTNNGSVVNVAGNFTHSQAFTNNKTIENRSGATFKTDFGASFTNAAGSSIANAGIFQNFAAFENTTSIVNTGTFINNGTLSSAGSILNEGAARFENPGTLNLSGNFENKPTATTLTAFRFNVLAGATVVNSSIFDNRDQVDIRAGGSFVHSGTLTSGFGTKITNSGLLRIVLGATISSNGEISNSSRLENYGLIQSDNGAQLINTDSLFNYGTVKNVNALSSSKYWLNKGVIENNSGGIFNNTGVFLNDLGARVVNSFEIYNRLGAIFTNNGNLENTIRIFNEGSFFNNAYLRSTGDFLNRASGVFANSEVFDINEGSLQNEGRFVNNKTLLNRQCGTVSNRAGATIQNNGLFENSGLVFQRGTLSGTALVAKGGFVHTSATSDAPAICLTDVIDVGLDIAAEAKVYGQTVVVGNLGIDSCFAYQYFFEGVNRKVYNCDKLDQTLTGRFKLLTRTGDSLTCSARVRILDPVSPTFTSCPKDVTVYSNTDNPTVSWPAVTAVDNCTPVTSLVFTTSKASGTTFPVGATTVSINVRDAKGNGNDCIFGVNVVRVNSTATCPTGDVTVPVFSNCPQNQTLSTINGGAAAAWNEPSVSDNCFPISVRSSAKSGSFFPVGSTTVTYTATDSRNNVGTCSFNIVVNGTNPCTNDAVKPVISNCPVNFFATTNGTISGAVAYWSDPSVSDNCGSATLTSTRVSGSVFPVGSTTVTYTATDANGNTSTCNFLVCVANVNACIGDVTAPTLSCPANVNVNATGLTATATWAVPTATDACAPVTLNGTHTPGSVFAVGRTEVSYTASDKVGNARTCKFTVTVNNPCFADTIKPVLSACPANITRSTSGTSATATWTAPTATDNCGATTITSNFASGASFNLGATTVLYTATDARGNKSTCSFTVTVQQATTVGSCGVIASVRPAVNTIYPCYPTVPAYAFYTEGDQARYQAQQLRFVEFTNGTAILVGTVEGHGRTVRIDVALSGKTSTAPAGSPYLSGCVNQASADWYYYTSFKGVLSFSDGEIVDIVSRGGAFQVGTGAQTTNPATYGASGWWAGSNGLLGDFNFDLAAAIPCVADCNRPTGGLSREKWNIGSNWKSPVEIPTSAPDEVNTITSGQGPINIGDNYTTRVRGYLRPTTAGRYKFIVTGDDFTDLYLSPNSDPANKGRIAYIKGWTTNDELSKYPSQQSMFIDLEAGKTYYIELTTAEGGGGDNFAIFWQREGTASPVIVPGANLSTFQNCVTPPVTCNRVSSSLLALYTFKEKTGNKVFDKSGSGAPLDLTIGHAQNTTWLNGGGIRINSGTIIRSDVPAIKFNSAISQSHAITVEAWVKPANTTQSGPSRIVTHSDNTGVRNFTLGQDGDDYIARLRTSSTDGNGLPTVSTTASLSTNLQHVVYTREASGAERIFVNGVQKYSGTRAGTITNWNLNSHFAIANEMTLDRSWLGEIYLVAVYGKALNTNEITQNFQSGATICNPQPGPCVNNGGLLHERWNNAPPNWAQPIQLPTTSPNYINAGAPDYKAPQYNANDNYYARARGFIKPSVSGNYQFNVTGDDYTELFLSTNQSPTTMQKIAYHYSWTTEHEYNKTPTQTSATIYLEANKLYYTELRQVEGGGGDFYQVQWKTPSNANWAIVPSANLSRPCSNTQVLNALVKDVFSFEARRDYKQARLEWVSNTGYKNDAFVVEKADAQGDFQPLKLVKANSGLNTLEAFDFTDENTIEGDNHYRIRTVFVDGTEKISEIKTLNFTRVSDIRVFPNPANDFIKIDLSKFEGLAIELELYNVLGKSVRIETIERASVQAHTIDTNDLIDGTYFLRVKPQGKREQTIQVKLVK
jgi:hypothetical protein